jgi:hypothetical protein
MINRLLLAIILLLAGAAIGLGLGLYVGWVAWPVSYQDITVAALGEAYRDDYVVMVATAYGWDGDLDLARERLGALEPADPAAPLALVEATAARLAELSDPPAPPADLQRLSRLAADLRAAGTPGPAPGGATPGPAP